MRVLVFQHAEAAHPGRFADLWRARGHVCDFVRLDDGQRIPDLIPYDVLVVMGAPMDVWEEREYPWLIDEKAAIRRWVDGLDRPFIGVCFGHQILADALGGEVRPMISPEVGLAEVNLTPAGRKDPIFAGFVDQFEVLQWHGVEVARVPRGSEVLAQNSACAVQAFRYGRHAYGFQYNVELTEDTVAEWRRVPEYRAQLEAVLGANGATKLGQAVMQRLPAFYAKTARLDENLAQILSDVGLRG